MGVITSKEYEDKIFSDTVFIEQMKSGSITTTEIFNHRNFSLWCSLFHNSDEIRAYKRLMYLINLRNMGE